MLTRIVVPLDGSALAESALPHAEALARSCHAEVVLVRAALAQTFPGTDPTESQVQAVETAQAYLDQVAARLGSQGMTVETAVPYGEAAEAILAEVALRQADLVVMATHGRSGLSRMVSGSVAEAVLARSPVPVLLVRAWQEGPAGPALRQRPRLLVPLDGSPFAEAALPVAADLAAQLGGDLVLLHAVPPPDQVVTAGGRVVAYLAYGSAARDLEQEVDLLRTDAQGYLDRVANRLALHMGTERPEIDVRVGPAAEAIVAAAHEHDATLAVMATHARQGLGRLIFGSVVAGVLRYGSVPLLAVPPSAARIAAAVPGRRRAS